MTSRRPFKMAESAKVDVVPVAICDLWRWHPPSAHPEFGTSRN